MLLIEPLVACYFLNQLSLVNLFYAILVRLLREELQLLQEQGSYVGEVVKPMDKKKVLVKVCIIFHCLSISIAFIS